MFSGGFSLGPGGTGPPNLAQPPIFLIGSIVSSLSRCCLPIPNDEGPGPQIFFPRTATGHVNWANNRLSLESSIVKITSFSRYLL